MATLQFAPLQSKVDVTFWSALGDLKLHRLKLEEGPEPLRASWTPSNHAELPGFLTVSAASLPGAAQEAGAAPAAGFEAVGDLYLLNTEERMLKFDRKAAVGQVGSRIWTAIQSGQAEQNPALLLGAVLLTYCDLKHYKYRYWFAVPALQPPQPFTLAGPPVSLAHALGEQAEAVAAGCSSHVTTAGQPAWLVVVGPGAEVQTAALSEWHRLQQEADGRGGAQLLLAVADSSCLAEHPGWPLRNVLLLAAARWGARRLRVLCLRRRHGRFDAAASLALSVDLPQLPPGFCPTPLGGWELGEQGLKAAPRCADLGPSMDPRQLAEAAVDLNLRLMRWRAAPSLDVGAIAATRCLLLGAGTLGCSVARCLLGWGVRRITLVDSSRVAYSNPVRQSLFTFQDCLDGGRPKAEAAAEALAAVFPGVQAAGVQLSIPMPGHPIAGGEEQQVRRDIAALEALVDDHDVAFLLTDTRESRWLPTLLCAARGRLALTAALGFDGFMVIRHGAPLPPEAPREQAPVGQKERQEEEEAHAQEGAAEAAGEGGADEAAVEAGPGAALEAGECGAVMAGGGQAPDEPESAPAAPQEKQRPPPPPVAASRGAPLRLGCYFCNDVVAPLNSTADRALDQQCTVARPGLSAIAGSLAVELMAAVVAHPLGAAAPPPGTPAAAAAAKADGPPPLGDPPHMVRGSLAAFSQLCLTGQSFRQCTACSEVVVTQYRQRGHDFLLQGLLSPASLEDLTGLTELHRASEAALEAWGSSDEEEGEGEGEGGCQGGSKPQNASSGDATAADGDEWEEL